MSLVEPEQHQIAECLGRMDDAEDRLLLIVKPVLLMLISDEVLHGVPDRIRAIAREAFFTFLRSVGGR
jgi:hypothetical protein